MTKIKVWTQKPLHSQIESFRKAYWRAKTFLIYRPFFQHLGAGTVIRNPILISNPDCIFLGQNVSIRDGVRLEAIRDGYGRTPQLKIGSGTFIEQNVQIVCHNRITIGDNVAIAGACAIVDVNHPFRDMKIRNGVASHIADEDSFVEIGDGAFVGYGAVILPNVRIGERAVIGANSVVTRDVPSFAIAAGAPARIVERLSRDTSSDSPLSQRR